MLVELLHNEDRKGMRAYMVLAVILEPDDSEFFQSHAGKQRGSYHEDRGLAAQHSVGRRGVVRLEDRPAVVPVEKVGEGAIDASPIGAGIVASVAVGAGRRGVPEQHPSVGFRVLHLHGFAENARASHRAHHQRFQRAGAGVPGGLAESARFPAVSAEIPDGRRRFAARGASVVVVLWQHGHGG